MKRKKEILTAVILSSTVGLGAQSIFAQGAPGGGQTGPTGRNRDKRNQRFRGNRRQVSHKRNQCRANQVLFLKESNGQAPATKAWLCPVTTSRKQRKPSKQKD